MPSPLAAALPLERAILLGAAIVFFLFPKHVDEKELLAEYHAQDASRR